MYIYIIKISLIQYRNLIHHFEYDDRIHDHMWLGVLFCHHGYNNIVLTLPVATGNTKLCLVFMIIIGWIFLFITKTEYSVLSVVKVCILWITFTIWWCMIWFIPLLDKWMRPKSTPFLKWNNTLHGQCCLTRVNWNTKLSSQSLSSVSTIMNTLFSRMNNYYHDYSYWYSYLFWLHAKQLVRCI